MRAAYITAHGGAEAIRFGELPDRVVGPADVLVRVDVVVLAVAHPAATAYLAWFDRARLRPGETVYVGGAAGNVGTAAVTMASRAGARVLAGARPADFDACRAAGAAEVADYADPGVADVLARLAPSGLDAFWDTSGRQDLSLAAAILRPGGRLVVTAGLGRRGSVPVSAMYTKDVTAVGFVISRASAAELARAAELINQLTAAGLLTAKIAGELPLSAASQAHQRMEAGLFRGRLLLRPEPSAGSSTPTTARMSSPASLLVTTSPASGDDMQTASRGNRASSRRPRGRRRPRQPRALARPECLLAGSRSASRPAR